MKRQVGDNEMSSGSEAPPSREPSKPSHINTPSLDLSYATSVSFLSTVTVTISKYLCQGQERDTCPQILSRLHADVNTKRKSCYVFVVSLL